MPNFDWSEFHPLSHWAFSWECWHWAGGPFRHISYWWFYQHQWPWSAFWQSIQCRRGNHVWLEVYKGSTDGPVESEECMWCSAQRPYTGVTGSSKEIDK